MPSTTNVAGVIASVPLSKSNTQTTPAVVESAAPKRSAVTALVVALTAPPLSSGCSFYPVVSGTRPAPPIPPLKTVPSHKKSSRDGSGVFSLEPLAGGLKQETPPRRHKTRFSRRRRSGAIRQDEAKWRREVLEPVASKKAPWKKDFTTVSGMEVNPAGDAERRGQDLDFGRDLAFPASSPTRAASIRPAIAASSGRCGSSPASAPRTQTNERFQYLLSQGQTGLSTAFHLPTLYGYDSDHQYSAGEVGKCGVAVDTLADMETIFDGINLEDVTVSMTINSTAPILLAMYLAVAAEAGADWKKICGTLQNDILKEYIAPEGVHLPAAPLDAADHRHLQVLRGERAEVQHDLDQRLSHPRGRIDGAAGAGVHAARRHGVRRVRRPRRPRHRRVRAAALVLLQLAQRPVRRRWRSSAPRAACGRR